MTYKLLMVPGDMTDRKTAKRHRPTIFAVFRLAEGFAAPDPGRSMAGIRRHPGSQMGFLTAD